jgi:peptidoglycan/xylan/chitin deacetylase (PgdA/CDA1 family)
MAALERKTILPPGAILLTFDDGYRDFLEVAWPVLKQYRVPAVLFVVSSFADNPTNLFWWDKLWQSVARTSADHLEVPGRGRFALHSFHQRILAADGITEWLKTLRPERRAAMLEAIHASLAITTEPLSAGLTWSELRTLQTDGVTLGAHSRTHPLLDQLGMKSLEAEVRGCRDDMVRELGQCAPLFAYPNGNVDQRVVNMLRGSGFAAGLTTRPGMNHVGRADAYRLRRDDARVSWHRFVLNLTTPVSVLRAWRHPSPGAPRGVEA